MPKFQQTRIMMTTEELKELLQRAEIVRQELNYGIQERIKILKEHHKIKKTKYSDELRILIESQKRTGK